MSRLSKLQDLLRMDPSDPFVLYGIAQEHARTATPAGHTESLNYYDLCLRADPHYCYAYYHKAVSLIELGRTDEARTTINDGLTAARAARDNKASNELHALLDSLD